MEIAIWVQTLLFIVALATFYLQFLRPPKLSLIPGENIAVSYDTKQRLVFILGVAILNDGARPGDVLRIYGDVNGSPFKWHSFADTSDAGTLKTAFSPMKKVDAWVHTLVVPGRDAIVKRIVFRTAERFEAAAGSFIVKIVAEGRERKWETSARFKLTDEAVTQLKALEPRKDDQYSFWFIKREADYELISLNPAPDVKKEV